MIWTEFFYDRMIKFLSFLTKKQITKTEFKKKKKTIKCDLKLK